MSQVSFWWLAAGGFLHGLIAVCSLVSGLQLTWDKNQHMNREFLRDKVLGCVIGASIGDSIGGPLEMATAERVRETLDGREWIDEMLLYRRPAGAHGVWQDDPPKGTGTDDTRYNQIFLETVCKHRSAVNSRQLAEAYIDRYRNVETFYPAYVALAREQLRPWYARACGHLGVVADDYPEIPVHVLNSDCFWGGFPVIAGLLALASAGLLWAGEPLQAYSHTFELAFCDLGYAKDATALMAAMVAMALEGSVAPKDIARSAVEINPYAALLDGFTGRQMTKRLQGLLALADQTRDDRALMMALASACSGLHVFDPVDVLNVPMTIIYHTDADPVRSILMAANHRLLNAEGELLQLRDTDCVAYVTGALVGAMRGLNAFPQDWVEAVIAANESVYGFNIMRNAEAFWKTVYGERT